VSAVELAVITVAGIGSRLGLNLPKGLVSLGGKTLLERQLAMLTDVPEVRIVVGYKEEEVVEHVRGIRDDVVFVRNRDYDRTSVLQSLYLGVRHWKGPFLSLDGDVMFEPGAFADFVRSCDTSTTGIVGLTPSSTDDAVYVETSEDSSGRLVIDGFQRSPFAAYEWSGLAWLDSSWVKDEKTFVFEMLARHLPLTGKVIPAFEIDTPGDLDRAHHALRTGDWTPPVHADSLREILRPVSAEQRFGVAEKSPEHVSNS
jgi:choline kinase